MALTEKWEICELHESQTACPLLQSNIKEQEKKLNRNVATARLVEGQHQTKDLSQRSLSCLC